MRLGWDEIKRRAKAFSEDWKDAHYEKGETQSFYNDFFEIFGIKRRQVAVYEKMVQGLDANRRGFIDLFWPGTLWQHTLKCRLTSDRFLGRRTSLTVTTDIVSGFRVRTRRLSNPRRQALSAYGPIGTIEPPAPGRLHGSLQITPARLGKCDTRSSLSSSYRGIRRKGAISYLSASAPLTPWRMTAACSCPTPDYSTSLS